MTDIYLTKEVLENNIAPLMKPGYIAQDMNGEWYWYQSKPELRSQCWVRGKAMDETVLLNSLFLLPKLKNWKETLIEIE